MEEFSSNLNLSFEDLKKDLQKIKKDAGNQNNVEKVASQAITRLKSSRNNATKEIQSINKNLGDQQALPQAERISAVKASERLGFASILEHDVKGAIQAFSQAEKIWPDYHNVAEIKLELVRQRSNLESKDSKSWTDLYTKILNQFSWGMPSDVRRELSNRVSRP